MSLLFAGSLQWLGALVRGGGGAGAVRSQVPVDVDTGVSDTGVGGATG